MKFAHRLHWLWLALVCLSVAACQTRTAFPTPGANWTTHTGQMQYVGREGKSVIGDVVVRQSPQGDFQLAFSSGPGFPLMRLYRAGDRVRAEGALARGSWEGTRDRAPQRLRGWASVPALFSRQKATRGTFDLKIAETGERFAFHFGS